MKWLIAGSGYLGARLEKHLRSGSETVFKLSRHPHTDDRETHLIRADLTDWQGENFPDADVVIFCAAPGERTEEAYETVYIRALGNLTRILRKRQFTGKFLITASTAVYGQNDGEKVTEESPAQPKSFNGMKLREAEEFLFTSGLRVVSARLSGIYGPGRMSLVDTVRAGGKPRSGADEFTNRIHVKDAAAALVHLALHDESENRIVNVTDTMAVKRREVTEWIAERLGLPVPAEPAGKISGKQVSSQLLQSTGFRFQFRDFRAGYEALIRESDLA